jgi:hypothetical protein
MSTVSTALKLITEPTLPFKSFWSVRNALVFQRKAILFCPLK